jgi:hypothetical protein
MSESPPSIDALDVTDLKALLLEAMARIGGLTAENAALREEIARLKGLKGRPSIKPSKPSGMEQGTSGTAAKQGKSLRRRGKQARVAPVEDQVLAVAVPMGSRFKSLPQRRRYGMHTSLRSRKEIITLTYH